MRKVRKSSIRTYVFIHIYVYPISTSECRGHLSYRNEPPLKSFVMLSIDFVVSERVFESEGGVSEYLANFSCDIVVMFVS